MSRATKIYFQFIFFYALIYSVPSFAITIDKYLLDAKLGLGSGLAFKAKNPDGSISLLSIADKNKDQDRYFALLNFGKKEVVLTQATELDLNSAQIDPEAIAIAGAESFYLAEESGPSILEVGAAGQILQRYVAGKELPKILQIIQNNRGFEGVAVTPSGKVYAALQSMLDIKSEANIIRIVEFDPKTKSTQLLAYPLQENFYRNIKDAKLGDLLALSRRSFLVLEQGESKSFGFVSRIYKIDTVQTNSRIAVKRKTLLVDLKKLGWNFEKAEGLAILPDHRTLIISNDADAKDRYKLADLRSKTNSRVGRLISRSGQADNEVWFIRLDKRIL